MKIASQMILHSALRNARQLIDEAAQDDGFVPAFGVEKAAAQDLSVGRVTASEALENPEIDPENTEVAEPEMVPQDSVERTNQNDRVPELVEIPPNPAGPAVIQADAPILEAELEALPKLIPANPREKLASDIKDATHRQLENQQVSLPKTIPIPMPIAVAAVPLTRQMMPIEAVSKNTIPVEPARAVRREVSAAALPRNVFGPIRSQTPQSVGVLLQTPAQTEMVEPASQPAASSTEPVLLGSPLTLGKIDIPAHAPLTTPSAQFARTIATQIVDQVKPAASGAMELQLSPKELGTVSIRLIPNEAGMVISIMAERLDTAELIRRHSDVLMQEFRQAGFGEPSMSFDGHEARQNAQKSGDQTVRNVSMPDDFDVQVQSVIHGASQRLNLVL